MTRLSSMAWLYGRYAWLVTFFPPVLKFLARLTYERLASRYPSPTMTFMNLGYVGGADEPGPVLEAVDEPNRLQLQLYHHVGTRIDLTGQDVLEVGCGRGGGASYVKRYLGPASLVGMDLANTAVDFCRRTHRVQGLRFVQGDAEKMPFDGQQFDVVMNVESSHCYPSVDAFFREVKRVLRTGGRFLYTDIMIKEQLPERRRMLTRAGLTIVQEEDIASRVLASLDSEADRRAAMAKVLAPVLGEEGARQWMVAPGSKALEGMRNGALCYVSMTLQVRQSSP